MPAIPIIGVAAAVVGTGYSIYAGERANSQAKKATKLQQQQADLSAARQKRDSVRQARMAYAQAQAAAENQGVSGSSSAQGGQASIVSQLNDNLSFLDQYGFISDQASKALGKAQSWRASAQMGGAIAGFGGTVFANAPQIEQTFNRIFKSG